MEETRIIKRVGNYLTIQANTEDCIKCKNAKFATILINDLCLGCYEEKVLERKIVKDFVDLCISSISPDKMEKLEEVVECLKENRHLPM